MKTREFIEHVKAHGCAFERHGAKHDIWKHGLTGMTFGIPRHTTLKKYLAHGICRKLNIPLLTKN